jgi:hypothetical protein
MPDVQPETYGPAAGGVGDPRRTGDPRASDRRDLEALAEFALSICFIRSLYIYILSSSSTEGDRK